MSSTILPAALTGLLTGGAAAAAIVFTQSPAPTAAPVGQAGNDSAILARLDSINGQQKGLIERLDRLENETQMAAPTAVRTSGNDNSASELAAMKAELQAMMEGIKSPAGVPAAKFEEMVASANENIEARERAERAEERKVREAEALEERLADMSTKLGLNQSQVGSMRDALTARTEQRTALWEEMRNGDWAGGRDAMREKMEVINNESKTTLQTFLTPTQFDQYQEDYGFDNGRGGGRGGRDGGGRGGGN